jgi:hypothetical protein
MYQKHQPQGFWRAKVTLPWLQQKEHDCALRFCADDSGMQVKSGGHGDKSETPTPTLGHDF